MQLTDEQKYVIKELLKFKKDVQTMSGPAGSGKSLLVVHLAKILKNFAICAPTGKAANVLQNRGIPAKTIHSLIYKPTVIEDRVYFTLAESLDCEGIIVDEGSMVNKELNEDMRSFGIPIIYVGDHEQLEPVGQDIYLMQNPDFELKEIHRNAGEIAHFADFIRKGFRPSAWRFKNPKKVKFITKKESDHYLDKVDQSICAFNKTRVEINNKTRQKLGHLTDWPNLNERLMCLRNNYARGLFNGMQGIVRAISPEPHNNITIEAQDYIIATKFDPNQLGQEKYDFSFDRDDPDPFDYCYGITAHKSQGSEWDTTMVFEQICNRWDHRRWAYTVASRAKKSEIWVMP